MSRLPAMNLRSWPFLYSFSIVGIPWAGPIFECQRTRYKNMEITPGKKEDTPVHRHLIQHPRPDTHTQTIKLN